MKVAKLVQSLVAAVVVSFSYQASASVVSYAFTANGGHFGSFSFDTAAASLGNGPFVSGATAYSALGLSIDGTAIANPLLVIYDNYYGTDWAYFTTTTGFDVFVQLGDDGNIFSSENASEMTNRTLADFNSSANELALANVGAFALTSLTRDQTNIPEPGTMALLGLGLAGFGLGRRKNRV